MSADLTSASTEVQSIDFSRPDSHIYRLLSPDRSRYVEAQVRLGLDTANSQGVRIRMSDADEQNERYSDELPHLAERLNLLFETVPRSPEDPRLHTANSVVEALREQGITVTPNHLRALRAGTRRNPSFRLLVGLAAVFHVPLDYFANDGVAADVQESIRALTALRDTRVKQLMTRSHGISPGGLSSILALLDQIRRIEGLDPADESSEDSEGTDG